MPEKSKRYDRVIFTPEVIAEAAAMVRKDVPAKTTAWGRTLSIEVAVGEQWEHDSEEEFFADYRKGFVSAQFGGWWGNAHRVTIWAYKDYTRIGVRMPSRADVEKVFGFIESNVDKCRLPEPPSKEKVRPRVKVFIGHGRDPQWRDLKDHLHEKHSVDVETYEIGPRAGLTIKEVLDDMLTSSSFAVLVLTGEDLDAEGVAHARENVIHELGLFQGRLGWRRAIALLQEGVAEFSNIHGLTQIRFGKGHIQETFGEVLATIRREFPL
jgi:predicted nucleotide-binding protein